MTLATEKSQTLTSTPSVSKKAQTARDWLKAQIARSKTEGIFTENVKLTPELAEALLENNPDNRSISQLNVERLAKDLKEGTFAANGQTLVVAKTGELNDGQHRCWAVIESGVAFKAIIVFGVDRDTRTTLDQGIQRRASHFLQMLGYKNTIVLAAAGAFAWQYKNLGRFADTSSQRPTKQEVLTFIENNPDLEQSILHLRTNVTSSPITTFCHWAIKRVAGEARATEFMEKLQSGTDLGAKSPILYARNRLLAMRNHKKATSEEKVLLILRAWNAYATGHESVRTLQTGGRAGQFPRIEK